MLSLLALCLSLTPPLTSRIQAPKALPLPENQTLSSNIAWDTASFSSGSAFLPGALQYDQTFALVLQDGNFSSLLTQSPQNSISKDDSKQDAGAKQPWDGLFNKDNDDPNSPLYISPQHRIDIENDIKEGEKYDKEVLKEYKVDTDTKENERVNRIGNELAVIANSHHLKALWGDKRFSKFPMHFTILKGDDVNAFSLPGGYIYIFDGLIKYIQSDDELAGVLAHEMSHVEFRHVAELQAKASKLNIFTFPLILFGLITAGGSGLQAVTLGNMISQSSESGWSQEAEEAADYGGFQILCLSHYNPVGMLTMMEHLARDERLGPSQPLGIYRTHPPSPQRATLLESYIKKAGLPLNRSAVSKLFSTSIKPEDGGLVGLYFQNGLIFDFAGTEAVQRAEDASKAVNSFLDSTPELFMVTIGAEDNPFGNGQKLFTITPDDITASKLTLDQLALNTKNALQSAIYKYNTLIWMGQGAASSP